MIRELRLKSFRIYDALFMECNPSLNIIVGDNAQGKTSIIEAIYTLGLTKSHKTAKDFPLIKNGADYAKIFAKTTLKNRDAELEIVFSKEGKKAKYNHIDHPRLSDYIGYMNVVMFAPEDLDLIKGSPSERRRFLDLEIGQVNRHYVYHLNQYKKLLRERNEHLKALNKKHANADELLDVLDEQLMHYGTKIIQSRKSFIETLRKKLQPIYEALSGEKVVKLLYEPSVTEDSFKTELGKKRRLDFLTGATSVGPHRDDCGFYFEEDDVKRIASQGQIRTLALAIKLAVVAIIKEYKGQPPIVLLDDVFSELDESRQNKLMNLLEPETQVFITATSVGDMHLKGLKQYKLFTVEQGTIKGVSTHGH